MRPRGAYLSRPSVATSRGPADFDHSHENKTGAASPVPRSGFRCRTAVSSSTSSAPTSHAPESPTLAPEIVVGLKDYQVEVAGSGPIALEKAAACPFDLVLLEVMLPGMDGLAVLRRLKDSWPE